MPQTDPKTIPVYLVDDDNAVREALRYVLEGYGFQVKDFDSGERFLTAAPLDQPGCLILDARMPGMTGPEVHDRLNAAHTCLEVMFLTSHGDLPMAVRAFRGGACDFHQKPVNATELVPSVEKALYQSLLRHRNALHRQRFEQLTERERQLFELVVAGLINKQIADRLCISVRTVEVHRAKMMERLGAANLAELVKIAEGLNGSGLPTNAS